MIVHTEPGYAIDWDWSTDLTVWSTGVDRFEKVLGTHQLERVPRRQSQAARMAAAWWQRAGREELGSGGGQG